MDKINLEKFNEYSEIIKNIKNEVSKVVIGKKEAIDILIIGLLSSGHILVEDVPGLGKTTLALSLSKASGLLGRRMQFTPDVVASDITGFSIYNKAKNDFEYREGIVLCNILLADEINRTSPKTQAALLEAMEEGMVTVDGQIHKIPQPFMVIATQNPFGFVGTFPLPEAQLDRFMMKISMGYPTKAEEVDIISQRKNSNPLDNVKPCTTSDVLIKIKEFVSDIHIDNNINEYIVDLVKATRDNEKIALGASPRASLALMRVSQAKAFLEGRDYVIPEDISFMYPYIIKHRIVLKQEARLNKITVEDVLDEIISSVKIPFTGKK